MRSRRSAVLALSLLLGVALALPSAFGAALRPAGPTTQVGHGFGPRVAFFVDGGFVVAWNAPDTLRARLFDRDGVPVSDEIALVRPFGQFLSSVAALPAGFVVIWDQENQRSLRSVYARLFDRSGSPLVRPFKVHEDSQFHRVNGRVAARPNGGFAVAMEAPNDPNSQVITRFFDAAGNPLGPSNDRATLDTTANIIDVWVGPDDVLSVVFEPNRDVNIPLIERRDAAGALFVQLALEATPEDSLQGIDNNYGSIRLLPDGGARIIWASFGNAATGGTHASVVFAHRFDASGAAVGAAPLKVSGKIGWASGPLSAPLPDGGFVAIYNDLGSQPQPPAFSGAGQLFVRSFNADGSPATRPLRVSPGSSANQPGTFLAVGPGGQAVAAWLEPDPDFTHPGRIMVRSLRPPAP
jgi:hypothetical protein